MRAAIIQTHSGIAFDLLNPTPDMIDIGDIAHALSNVCRFGGHCREFYSVAQHSVHVAQWAYEATAEDYSYIDPSMASEVALWGLLHDAPEAYIGDMVRPLKHGSDCGVEFQQVERRIMDAICEKFDLDAAMPYHVREFDERLLAAEYRDIVRKTELKWNLDVEPTPEKIVPWKRFSPKSVFLTRFRLYGGLERGEK